MRDDSICDPDPPKRWTRKNYRETGLEHLDRRQRSELETNRDLDKPLEQLVCDVHEESHDPNRDTLENIAGAQKRMVSMMARVAQPNDRATRWMITLTIAIAAMTGVLVVLTVLMLR